MGTYTKREECKAILDFFRTLKKEMPAKEAQKETASEFKKDIRTIKNILKGEEELEKYEIREKLILDAQNKRGVNWKSLESKAIDILCDVIWNEKELNVSEKWVVEMIFKRIDAEAKKGKNELDELEVYI